MPEPTAQPDTPPTGPTVCDCGYELTGSPAQANAKCPECGAVISTVRSRVRITFVGYLLLVVAVAPSLVAAFEPFLQRLHQGGFLSTSTLDAIAWIGLGWLFFVSMPASVLFVQPYIAGKPVPERLMPQVGAVGLCFLVNVLIFYIAFFVFM